MARATSAVKKERTFTIDLTEQEARDLYSVIYASAHSSRTATTLGLNRDLLAFNLSSAERNVALAVEKVLDGALKDA